MGRWRKPQRYKDNAAYNRSEDYRAKYFKKHKGYFGLYCCSYCGKLLTKKNATIDHIVPVNAAKYSRFLRWRLRHTEDGINNLGNLTVACRRCNMKKGAKRGEWAIRGRVGRYAYPTLWFLTLAFGPRVASYAIAFAMVYIF